MNNDKSKKNVTVANGKNKPFIRVTNIDKSFRIGPVEVNALKKISFDIKQGEFIALGGASGAGKSTMLHLMGGLERPSAGKIEIGGHNLREMDEDELALFRRNNVGFVFQFFNLIPSLTAIENVMISHIFEPTAEDENVWKRALELLEQMGLKKRLEHRPRELSGGEQQRVAIARALLNRPKLLLADEPTGNIDSEAGAGIMELFRDLNRQGTTIIVATHDRDVIRYAKRVIELRDGALRSDTISS